MKIRVKKRTNGGKVVGEGAFGCIVKVVKTKSNTYIYKMITTVRDQGELEKRIESLTLSQKDLIHTGISTLLSQSAETIKEIDNCRLLNYSLSKPENRQFRKYYGLIESTENVIFDNNSTMRARGVQQPNIQYCKAKFLSRLSDIMHKAATLELSIDLDISLLKMRYIQGDTFRTYIHNNTAIHEYYRQSPGKFMTMCFQLIHALKFMHDNSIVHRDIKSENIMWDEVNQVPVYIDFGFSRHLHPRSIVSRDDYRYGTFFFKPPESVIVWSNITQSALPIALTQLYRDDSTILQIWDPDKRYTMPYLQRITEKLLRIYKKSPATLLTIENLLKFDVFSLGCTLYENFVEIYSFNEFHRYSWAEKLFKLFMQMMNPDVFNRPTANTVYNMMFNMRSEFLNPN